MGDNNDTRQLARELRNTLQECAENLDTHLKNRNIARVTGGSVAAVAGIVAVAGLIAMPFTMGISAVVAAVAGGTMAAVGGLTAGGAIITNYIIDRKKLRKMEKKWTDFCKRVIEEQQRGAMNQQLPGANGANMTAGAMNAGTAGLTAAAAGATLASGLARTSVATGTTAARLGAAVAGGTVVLNVVLLGFSLYDIIDGALELHREKKAPAGDVLRKLATELERAYEL